MREPLIPYVSVPELPLTFLRHVPVIGRLVDPGEPPSIKPFGALVALGVYLGATLAIRRARERQLDARKMTEFITWVVGAGFVGAHVLDAIFYHPEAVAKNPLYLLKLWSGLSSFGGFVGAVAGALAWKLSRGARILPYCEIICSAFPLAWVFGRAGCAVAHDHPGRVSDALIAVRYPMGSTVIGRFDLGLYECLLTIPLAVAFAVLWKRGPRPLGFFIGWMCTLYAPVRFCLDFLRADETAGVVGGDPRYWGLTPAQWASFVLLAVGLAFLNRTRHREGAAPRSMPVAARADGIPP